MIKKKNLLFAGIFILFFNFSACNAKNDTVNREENQTAKEEAAEKENKEKKADDNLKAANQKAASKYETRNGFIAYNNAEFKLSLDIPEEWGEPQEKITEKTLSVKIHKEDLAENMTAIVKEKPAEAATIQDFEQESIQNIKASYQVADFSMEEILTLNGVDFLKLTAIDDAAKQVKIYYTGFSESMLYEIGVVLPVGEFEKQDGVIADIEKSIRVGDI